MSQWSSLEKEFIHYASLIKQRDSIMDALK